MSRRRDLRGLPSGRGTASLALAFTLAVFAAAATGCISRTEGEKLWSQNCAECHGSNGRGNLPAYSRYPLVNLVDDAWGGDTDPGNLEQTIWEGVFPVMPPFDHLTDEEIAQILEHLRVLRGEAY